MNPFGRPRQYETVEDLEAVISEYFNEVEVTGIHPTVTGLCIAVNLTREGLLTYQGRDEFSDTIKRAKQFIEGYVEETLMSGKATAGAIFNLKNNFGWKDEHKQTVSGPDGQPVAVIERHIVNP